MVNADWTKVQLRALGKVLRVSTVSGERDYQKSRLSMGIRWTTTGVNTALLISLSLNLRSNGCWRKRNRRGIARMFALERDRRRGAPGANTRKLIRVSKVEAVFRKPAGSRARALLRSDRIR